MYNWPEMHAIQNMLRDVSIGSPGCIFPHLVERVYETYVRVAVDSFTCSQEVDDLADGSVDQLSVNEILKFLLVRLSSVGHLESTLP